MKIKCDSIEHAMIVNAARNTPYTSRMIRLKLEQTYGLELDQAINKAIEDIGKDYEPHTTKSS